MFSSNTSPIGGSDSPTFLRLRTCRPIDHDRLCKGSVVRESLLVLEKPERITKEVSERERGQVSRSWLPSRRYSRATQGRTTLW